ncbi:amidophosphoribosyltransferase [Oleidesulfovibrio alaskensis G20]|jgi:amidophosphoribosyltransferase|uniref:Amidophosphoribosyltransferase n=1 Tax=Oleidesulfovibrio alaskensis (strain ATCC BAA-1058 / DSM 17464 / G20) TaxID=207559 RepID=Q316L1_OLEA2|nr:amidophosphoribosyltransferase [Oleidesulfovibrio alaskensis]ABB37135.1 amidophosphoribosyltransferase [Oleidesulfovibrio alaskensis G20]MBG0774147.1 amidophosphoribosyltransferase [Oleidesulfovibrio alaskensis]MBL3582939.1 amidophosphoribosyltransferase [Oleidesulfovibrio alaskensis]
MKREYCGVFGIYNHAEAARMTYFGLYALQHRGQESAGIVTWDGSALREERGMGLVPEVFNERHLSKELKGDIAIGHTRYSTTGASLLRNAQPFRVRYKNMDIAIAHNGNLVNTVELRSRLEESGSIFQTTNDSEVIVHLIAKHMNGGTVEEAVMAACREARGAYSLLILANDKMIAVRDPHGFRPLLLGKVGDAHVFASESCAFDLLEAELIRSVKPGEMIVIDKGKVHSYDMDMGKKRHHCIFELIYFARPDSMVFGENVYFCRKAMGKQLATEAPVDADFVMPFPDSGVYCAVGYAQQSGLPYEHAMIRNHYVGRTFIQPSQDMRDYSVRVKINPVKDMIKDKRIIIVDDSIVRGTTIRTRVKKLRELGAREVHFRVSCPPIKFPCFYGIDFASKGELIAANHSVREIERFIGLDSLHYISIEGLLKSVSTPDDYCLACFTGSYPLQCEGNLKSCLECGC